MKGRGLLRVAVLSKAGQRRDACERSLCGTIERRVGLWNVRGRAHASSAEDAQVLCRSCCCMPQERKEIENQTCVNMRRVVLAAGPRARIRANGDQSSSALSGNCRCLTAIHRANDVRRLDNDTEHACVQAVCRCLPSRSRRSRPIFIRSSPSRNECAAGGRYLRCCPTDRTSQ